MKCDHIFVVAEINRAVASRSLQSSVSGILKRHVPIGWKASGGKHLGVVVICTKSEVRTLFSYDDGPLIQSQDLVVKSVRRDLNSSGRLSESQVQRLVELDRDIRQASDGQRREACKLR